jgi:hypothetical protein
MSKYNFSTSALLKKEANFNRYSLLPLNLRDNNELEKVDSRLVPSIKKLGFRDYKEMVTIKNVNSLAEELIKSECQILISKLEKDTVYNILPCIFWSTDNSKYRSTSIFPNAMFIHKNSSYISLAYEIINRLRNAEMKYETVFIYSLVITGRIWFNKTDLLESESKDKDTKYTELLQKIDKTGVAKRGHNQENEELIGSTRRGLLKTKELFLDKTLKKLYFKDSLQFKLTPAQINKLNIITGDFTYTLYSLDKYVNSKGGLIFSSSTYLLSFEYFPTTINYIIESGNVLYSWSDTALITEKKFLRKSYGIEIYFKNNYTSQQFVDYVNFKYNFKQLMEKPKTHLSNFNIGTIKLLTYTVNKVKGTQKVFAIGWSAGSEVFTEFVGSDGIFNASDLIKKV